mmetsp:Transcript_12927/g.21490  ORF Transcript_12927/g.21490 Transcript_12927/m.21490 type:complete len:210 (-) Transcript_12927:272-901(-)
MASTRTCLGQQALIILRNTVRSECPSKWQLAVSGGVGTIAPDVAPVPVVVLTVTTFASSSPAAVAFSCSASSCCLASFSFPPPPPPPAPASAAPASAAPSLPLPSASSLSSRTPSSSSSSSSRFRFLPTTTSSASSLAAPTASPVAPLLLVAAVENLLTPCSRCRGGASKHIAFTVSSGYSNKLNLKVAFSDEARSVAAFSELCRFNGL